MKNETSQNWNENEWDNFSAWLKKTLHEGDVKVTFTKKDGSERVMLCTLKEDKLPSVVNENKREKKKSESTIAVYDLEMNGWRSFTIKSVKFVEA